MNSVLELKGEVKSRNKPSAHFPPKNIKEGEQITVADFDNLINQLDNIASFWKNDTRIGGALVSVHYKRIIPKSLRIQYLLKEKGASPDESICGAKFGEYYDNGICRKAHIFTYFVSVDTLESTKKLLELCRYLLIRDYNGIATSETTKKINEGCYDKTLINKTRLLGCFVDVAAVLKFDIDIDDSVDKENGIVSLYRTNANNEVLLEKLGVRNISSKKLDEDTFLLDKDELTALRNEAPYLISMGVVDWTEIPELDTGDSQELYQVQTIQNPTNEPIIGVIDSLFDENVYFSKWVEHHNMLDPSLPIDSRDYRHGTSITSLIVDAPSINPNLDDGCGNFRVRHFSVAKYGRNSSFTIIKKIRQIVAENTDIKVWNLSLGSNEEINSNFISPEAAELDSLQNEYDVIFVVAGTNNKIDDRKDMKIGAPADSLNSLVVNSVGFDNKPASYKRVGPVLSFFYKPDVSYYGGDGNKKEELIRVCEPLGEGFRAGTSYAAPLIARKLAYLIHIMGLSKELAKALIIDSAAGWDRKDSISHDIGYGVVPVHINDIVETREDEIKFMLSGTVMKYETYTYNIPVPMVNDAFPFFAKATMAYFPKCDRKQGVDYTSTELDIHIGRVTGEDIKPIDDNTQDRQGVKGTYEEDARRLYRKWDNVKHVSEKINSKSRPRKSYGTDRWGFEIKTKERMDPNAGRGIKFGVVVTLKEMNGKNRIDDFIQACSLRGWFVNRLDINNRINLYNKGEEELILE